MSMMIRIERQLKAYAQRNMPTPDFILLGATEYYKLKNELYGVGPYRLPQADREDFELYGISVIKVHKHTHLSIGYTERDTKLCI